MTDMFYTLAAHDTQMRIIVPLFLHIVAHLNRHAHPIAPYDNLVQDECMYYKFLVTLAPNN